MKTMCCTAGILACLVIVGNRCHRIHANEPPALSGPAEQLPTYDAALRTNRDLVVLYEFHGTDGTIVKDTAGVGRPMDLKIEDPTVVRRLPGSLEVRGKTLIVAEQPPDRLLAALQRTGEITIEAWIQSSSTKQSGPARIVTLSRNGTSRNFTLGQDGDRLDVRLRTTQTSSNGLPSLSSKKRSLTTEMLHVAYTRNRQGQARLYINGEQNAEKNVDGSFSNWDQSFRLALANEHDMKRPWRGKYHLVAIFSRALSPEELQRNFNAGPSAKTPAAVSLAKAVADPRVRQFELQVAPLLANHCLECHDSVTRQGELDLSKKAAALAGGESGPAIVPGKAGDSLLWESVAADEMPHDRPPLSERQKETLSQWIADGAVWSLDTLDPAVYLHGGSTTENWLRRLTVSEYIETVGHALGVDISKEARALLPPDLRADGFSNTAYNLGVDFKHVDAYGKLAEIIVQRLDVLEFAAQFSSSQKFTDKDMGNLITKMGEWLLRGPVDEHEVITYRGISTSVIASGGDYAEAVGLIVEAMLQSPRFLYRMEDQRGDGSKLPVTDSELAARVSYILWGGPPDRELLRAAETGDLADPEGLQRHVRRMLADPRAIAQSARFISDWFNLPRLTNLRPNPELYPDWDPRLAEDMRAETLAFFHEVVWEQNRPLADLLNAQVTFATPRLARHYGLQADVTEAFARSALRRYDLSSQPSRGGLLTQGSLLTVGGDEASMVTRGLLVMHELLRGVVKDPPPCVNTTPISTKPGLTQRAIAMARVADESCGGCHVKFEPLAFGLERFDGLGGYHEQDEHGNALRDDGQILFPGEAAAVAFESTAELMNMLANSDRVRTSITWKLTQFALGRPLAAADAATLGFIHKQAEAAGGTYKSLMTAIVLSDLVQMIDTEARQRD